MFEVILIWLPIFFVWPIAPYLLAKKKGKTVSRFLLLSLFLYPFVMVYLLLASDSSSGDLDLDYFDKLRGIHGVSDGLAREIMSHFPTAKKLARASGKNHGYTGSRGADCQLNKDEIQINLTSYHLWPETIFPATNHAAG